MHPGLMCWDQQSPRGSKTISYDSRKSHMVGINYVLVRFFL
jgi:hypothetical protein